MHTQIRIRPWSTREFFDESSSLFFYLFWNKRCIEKNEEKKPHDTKILADCFKFFHKFCLVPLVLFPFENLFRFFSFILIETEYQICPCAVCRVPWAVRRAPYLFSCLKFYDFSLPKRKKKKQKKALHCCTWMQLNFCLSTEKYQKWLASPIAYLFICIRIHRFEIRMLIKMQTDHEWTTQKRTPKKQNGKTTKPNGSISILHMHIALLKTHLDILWFVYCAYRIRFLFSFSIFVFSSSFPSTLIIGVYFILFAVYNSPFYFCLCLQPIFLNVRFQRKRITPCEPCKLTKTKMIIDRLLFINIKRVCMWNVKKKHGKKYNNNIIITNNNQTNANV